MNRYTLSLVRQPVMVMMFSTSASAKDIYVSTSFHEPANEGLRFIYSYDGINWNPIEGTFLAPKVGNQKVMRDPSIVKGPDGTFHLVWTSSWRGDKGFGYASSKDLIHWTMGFEDLGTIGDFDFNDVVLDVKYGYPAGDKTTIILQAAGGKLPLCIGVLDDEHEVHKLFGVSLNTMVNTEDWTAHKDPVTFTIDVQYGSGNINNLPIWVQKGSDWVLLTAHKGKAASKIAVSTDYKWVKELKDISNAYKNFDTYVTNCTPEWWKDNKDDSLIYNAQ